MDNNHAEVLNRFNPFGNETEYTGFNSDYREIEPKIALGDFSLPLKPEPAERKKIKSFYGKAGLLLCIHIALSFVLDKILGGIVTLTLKSIMFPDNTQATLERYVNRTSISISLDILLFLGVNLLVFAIGCKLIKAKDTKLKAVNFFSGEKTKPRTLLSYIFIGLGLQTLASGIIELITYTYSFTGSSLYTPSFETYGNPKIIAVTAIYTCLVAPVTEELIFRGVLLKGLSVTSQRTGILASALLFGLFHQNITQAISAFILGLFLAHTTVKHNSILPAIAVHIAYNLNTLILGLYEDFFAENIALYATSIQLGLVTATGLVCYIVFLKNKNRMPKATPPQKKRGLRLVFTSVPIVLATIIYLSVIVITQVTYKSQ
jgi:membrane protease YdiL (CAAX protease family)